MSDVSAPECEAPHEDFAVDGTVGNGSPGSTRADDGGAFGLGDSIVLGLLYFWLTSSIVAMGVALGVGYLPEVPTGAHKFDYDGDFYANWDGQWYKDIARHGYFYKEHDYSSVAFFPAFPLAGRLVARVTGLREEAALLVVANVFLAAAFALFSVYLRERFPDAPKDFRGYALLAMGILPTTFFFRMAYSESTFLICQILALLGIARRWPLAVVALVIGLGTATRPVGVALIPALLLYTKDQSATRGGYVLKSAMLVPLACWGVAAYMIYQAVAFGDPIAFARTQANWAARTAPSLGAKVVALATLEPFWTLYTPSAPGYWGKHTGPLDFPFSLRAADPFFFLGALGLIFLGFVKKWLSKYEAVTGACLLLIPYWTHGYEQHLTSMGRFAAAVVPVYPVLGRIAAAIPAPLVAALAAMSGFLLGAEAAFFVRWHTII